MSQLPPSMSPATTPIAPAAGASRLFSSATSGDLGIIASMPGTSAGSVRFRIISRAIRFVTSYSGVPPTPGIRPTRLVSTDRNDVEFSPASMCHERVKRSARSARRGAASPRASRRELQLPAIVFVGVPQLGILAVETREKIRADRCQRDQIADQSAARMRDDADAGVARQGGSRSRRCRWAVAHRAVLEGVDLIAEGCRSPCH